MSCANFVRENWLRSPTLYYSLEVAHVLCIIGKWPVFLATLSPSWSCACTLHNRNILSENSVLSYLVLWLIDALFVGTIGTRKAKNSAIPHVPAGLDVAHVLCIIGTRGPLRAIHISHYAGIGLRMYFAQLAQDIRAAIPMDAIQLA